MAQEVAPFGTEFTLAEPGPRPTSSAAALSERLARLEAQKALACSADLEA